MKQKTAYALAAPPLAFALFHHVVIRRGGAYLLLDCGAPLRPVLLVHLGALGAGALAGALARRVPPWRAPFLLALTALAAGAGEVLAFLAFASAPGFALFAYGFAALFGALVGLLCSTLARALPPLLTVDEQLFAWVRVEVLLPLLAASAAYLALADRAGPLRTGLFLALLLALAAHAGASALAPHAPRSGAARRASLSAALGLGALLVLAEPLTPWAEVQRVPDPIIFAHNTADSRIVVTSGRGALQLYQDGLLRLSTIDAHRRREVTVHPAMQAARARGRVLLVGGGDGAALREVLRYDDAREVTVIEPDPALLELGRQEPFLLSENAGSLGSPRVRAAGQDPYGYLEASAERFDVILVDLPDPEGPLRAKLYTRAFYEKLGAHLAEGGVGALATTSSPSGMREAYWCSVRTLEAAGLFALPYRAHLPSVGEAGFALFSGRPLEPPTRVPPGLRYLDEPTLADLFRLAPDELPVPVEPNLLYRQVLLKYRASALL